MCTNMDTKKCSQHFSSTTTCPQGVWRMVWIRLHGREHEVGQVLAASGFKSARPPDFTSFPSSTDGYLYYGVQSES